MHAIRERLGLTQEQAAEKIGVTRQTWIRWETGARKPSKPYLILFDMLEADRL
jgi:DNA-binding XRE family transcriptional regulator